MHWPVSRADQRHARWLGAAAITLAAIAALCAARPAGAAVTLGQLAPTPPAPQAPPCMSAADYLQPSVTGGDLYIARQAGTITSWSTRSSGAGATYVFKVFRRTSDPDVFQVIARAPPHELSLGINTAPVSIAVRSGDMIGLHESGGPNSCTFPHPGDGVLTSDGDLSEGSSGQFTPENDVRLNLSAVLVPSNGFYVSSIARDRKLGTVTLLVTVSNPGVLTISGKGVKKRRARSIAVAGTAQINVAAAGKRRRKLERTGKVTVVPKLTFVPTGGDAASKPVTVRLLRKRRALPPLLTP